MKDSGSSLGKGLADKSQAHTLTKFPRSDDSDDEDRTDVCCSLLFKYAVNHKKRDILFLTITLANLN